MPDEGSVTFPFSAMRNINKLNFRGLLVIVTTVMIKMTAVKIVFYNNSHQWDLSLNADFYKRLLNAHLLLSSRCWKPYTAFSGHQLMAWGF